MVHQTFAMVGSMAVRIEPITVDMEEIGDISGTGYSQYAATHSWVGRLVSQGTVDLVAVGPQGTLEVKFIPWTGQSRKRECLLL